MVFLPLTARIQQHGASGPEFEVSVTSEGKVGVLQAGGTCTGQSANPTPGFVETRNRCYIQHVCDDTFDLQMGFELITGI